MDGGGGGSTLLTIVDESLLPRVIFSLSMYVCPSMLSPLCFSFPMYTCDASPPRKRADVVPQLASEAACEVRRLAVAKLCMEM
jgi:hypothetical protein